MISCGLVSWVVQDRQVEVAKARLVGEDVDFDDLPLCDREADYGKRPSPWRRDETGGSVHQRWLGELSKP